MTMDAKLHTVITMEGVEYPLCQNIDALCLFEEKSGKDYTAIRVTSIRDTSLLFWCMAVAGSRRERKEFPMTYEEFRKTADMDALNEWFARNSGEVQTGGKSDVEKKSPSRSVKR